VLFQNQALTLIKHLEETDLGMTPGQVLASGATLVLPWLGSQFLTSLAVRADVTIAGGNAQLLITPELMMPDGVNTMQPGQLINQVLTPATGVVSCYVDQRMDFSGRWSWYGGTSITSTRNSTWPHRDMRLRVANNGPQPITFNRFQVSCSQAYS
jgi:hypothetical protein